jgi:cytochrome c2
MKQSRGVAVMLGWHALVIAFLLLLPGIKARTPIWLGDPSEMHAAFLLAGAYLVGVLIVAVARVRSRPLGIFLPICVTLAALGVVCLDFLLTKTTPFASRFVLLSIVASATVLAAIGFALQRFRAFALVVLAAIVCGALFIEVRGAYGAKRAAPMEKAVSNIATAFYTLREVTYRNAVPGTVHRGGAVAELGDHYLLATGDGRMYVFDLNAGGKEQLSIRPLPYKVPANTREFVADANPSGYGGKPNTEHADQLQGVQWWQFRVADIRVQEQGDKVRIFASHHYWKHKEQCFVVRVSSISGTREALLAGSPDLHWDTVWESTPCLPLRGENSVHENNPFAGMEIGGRLSFLDDHRLLLTLGDHDFTGVETKQMFSQDPAVSYGKTILIHLDDGSSEMFTMGHRNPQGLYVTPEGTIWSTEHGPQGGDELNLLVKGANYGWPLVTYGTDYGSAGWPLSHTQGRHDGYQQPIFAWVPSIGVSNLVRIEQDRFPVWKGELIVGSLHGHSLFRLHLVDQRVVFEEPIPVVERVRDIIEGHDGRLIIWTDTSSIMSITPAEGTDGAVLFANTCGGCHKAIDGQTHSYGPDLAGIVGRKVASAPGFTAYSPAMKAAGGKWTKERLDAFLAAPEKAIPGTAMTFRGVEDKAQRDAIIQYLTDLKY